MLDFTLHFVTLPLQKHTSEWDEKTEESQILLPGKLEFVASRIKQILWKRRLPTQLGYSFHTSFISLAEIYWGVFGPSFLKGCTFKQVVVSPANFILDE